MKLPQLAPRRLREMRQAERDVFVLSTAILAVLFIGFAVLSFVLAKAGMPR